MAFLKYVQAACNGGGSVHVQATGDAMPNGYASGDINVSAEACTAIKAASRIPSMRGSGRLYAVLTVDNENEEIVIGNIQVSTFGEVNQCLGNPRPPYTVANAAAVAARVATSQKAAATPAKVTPKKGSKTEALNKAFDAFRDSLLAILDD